ncbi:MAG: alanyl-tRNA editing protein, partial [Fusobacterium nucleatum]|nr:alanyl-tRNA editing protein [Fusobacterium nucleatum]
YCIFSQNFENSFIEYKGHKILIYNKDENLANILAKFVNLDKFLLLSGYDKNFSLNSNIYDCKAIILNITKSFPTIKGGGGKNKGNIKLDREYNRDELIELIKKGIDNNNEQ